MSDPTTDTPRRSETKHHAILEAAARCVGRDGYAATSIEAVAAEAGVGKQTIYRWWPSKPALFVEVYSALVNRTLLSPDGAVAAAPPGRPVSDLLRRLFGLYRSTPAGSILAGLIGAAAEDAQTRAAVRDGLVLGRRSILLDRIREAAPADADRSRMEHVNDLIVSMIWQRLIMAPEDLTNSFADELAQLVDTVGHAR
ncbi:MAG: TetR/AcrR family transcriptional regulator [Alphaproteobacteria bacterium]|nr:TetR/AcrR family transcriptional regulator [Alphaproteobacteria bacterium]MBO6863174.1 TetR/AcrR family transcriptional regulator [Alphaproteobacteria bacterium]